MLCALTFHPRGSRDEVMQSEHLSLEQRQLLAGHILEQAEKAQVQIELAVRPATHPTGTWKAGGRVCPAPFGGERV